MTGGGRHLGAVDPTIEQLIEASSFATPGANRLRARTRSDARRGRLTEPLTGERLGDQELRAAIRTGIQGLPERCQALLRLLVAEPRLSYQEIAARLQLPVGSIGPTRQRCLERLRNRAQLGAGIQQSADQNVPSGPADFQQALADGIGLVTGEAAPPEVSLEPKTRPGISGARTVAINTVNEQDRLVLRLLAGGFDINEIARTLGYDEATARKEIQRLFDRYQATNRPHLVALALRSGII